MNRLTRRARSRTAPFLVIAAAGLALAACGGSASSSGGSSSSGSSGGSASSGGSSSSGSGSSTQTAAFFPIAVGNTWVYKATIGGTIKNKIISVTPVSGGQKVTMGDTLGTASTPTKVSFIFHSDGSITFPSNQFGQDVSIIKGKLSWPTPAVIASGKPVTSELEMSINTGAKPQTVKAHITVQGDGTSSVTVPAGTYHASIVTESTSMAILGQKTTVEVKTWVVTGVGPVKTETLTSYLGTHKVTDTEELVSFTKG